MSAQGLACLGLTFQRPGGGLILDQLNSEFPAGGINLISGRTGTGKSTLLHLLAGLLRPTAGRVLADNQPVSRWLSVHKDVWRRQVGIVFQHLHLMPELTVMENVCVPLLPHRWTGSRQTARALEVLGLLDLDQLARHAVRTLSGGQRQRAAIARALVHRPRFILMDEPSAFQDDGQVEHLLTVLRELAGQGGCIVIGSHDPRLLAAGGLARTFVLENGRLALRR
jgi:ABC-type lipoprotein export system ATPase subunit